MIYYAGDRLALAVPIIEYISSSNPVIDIYYYQIIDILCRRQAVPIIEYISSANPPDVPACIPPPNLPDAKNPGNVAKYYQRKCSVCKNVNRSWTNLRAIVFKRTWMTLVTDEM